MNREGRYGSLIVTNKPMNRIGRYEPISEQTIKVTSPVTQPSLSVGQPYVNSKIVSPVNNQRVSVAPPVTQPNMRVVQPAESPGVRVAEPKYDTTPSKFNPNLYSDQGLVDEVNRRRGAVSVNAPRVPDLGGFSQQAQGPADIISDKDFLNKTDNGLVVVRGKKYPSGVLGNIMVGMASVDKNIPMKLLTAGGLFYSAVNTAITEPLLKFWGKDEVGGFKSSDITNSPREELKDNKYYKIGRDLAENKGDITIDELARALEASGSEVRKLAQPSVRVAGPQSQPNVRVAEPQQTPGLRVIGAEPTPEKISGIGGFIDSFANWDSKDLPYYGSGKEAVENIGVAVAFDKFKKGTATAEDKAKLDAYYKYQESEAKKRENVGYNAGEIIKGSARFMAELLPAVLTEIFTAGLAPTGDAMILNAAAKYGAKKTLQKMMKDSAYKATVTGALKNTVKREGILLTKQFALTAPTNITLGTASKMIGQIDMATGQVIDEGQPIGEALVNATSAHTVELLTERGGGVTGKILGKLTAPAKKVVVKTAIWQALRKRFPKAAESQLVTVLNKAGWNGVVGEWFEERDADVLNQALFAAGLGDQEFQGLTMEQIVSEIIAFSIMGGGHSVVTNVGGKLFKGDKDTGGQYQTLYHVTTPQAAAEINKTGVPKIEGDKAFYAWRTREDAERWAEISGENVEIVEVQAKPWNIKNAKERKSVTAQNNAGQPLYDVVYSESDFKPKDITVESEDIMFRGEGEAVRGIPAGLENVGVEGGQHKATVNVLGDDVVYFSRDKKVAGKYGDITEADVNLKNPLVLDNSKGYDGDIALFKLMQEQGVKSPLDINIQNEGAVAVKQATNDLKAAIEKAGYDGVEVVVKKGEDSQLNQLFEDDQTIVFDKSVIKEAQSKTVESEDKSSNKTGPGHRKFERWLQNLLTSKTILPEDAVIMRALVEDFNDQLLYDTKFFRVRADALSKGGSYKFSYDRLNLLEFLGLQGASSQQIRQGVIAWKKDRMQQNFPDSLIEYGTGELGLRTGLTNEGIASWVFAHEFSHLGYYMVLNEAERQIVIDEYNKLTKQERESLFSHVGESKRVKHYTGSPVEFFAQSGADYMIENKVPTAKMEPLLNKIAKKFYEGIRKLVNRGENDSVNRLRPLFEKILVGDRSTPLSEFAKKESLSHKAALREIMEVAPKTKKQQQLFKGSKPDPETQSLFESEPPRKGDSPMDAAQGIVDSLPPDIASTIEPLEKVLEGDIRTPLNVKIRWIDYMRTPWKVFDRMGIRPAYQKLLKGFEAYTKELPKNIDKITAWSKRVPEESNERIFRFLDGEGIELNPQEAQVASEIRAWLAEWADRLGMEPDARISEYITHIFPFSSSGEIPEEIALIINKKIPGSVYNPFLLQRKGAEGYLKNTWKALDAYTKRATRKVHMDPALEEIKAASAKFTDVSQKNYLERYMGGVNMRPTDIDTSIDNHIKEKAGYLFGGRPTARITRAIRMMISRAKIGGSATSFAKNITQGVNTFSELGTKYTVRGYADLSKFGAKELQENGVLIAPFIEDRTYSAIKKAAERFDKVLFLNMNASELVNRGAAYYGAKAKYLDGKISRKEFRAAFGENMPEGGYVPTKEDAITYGKFVSAKTQFLFGSLDTPVALNSDIMKMLFQFQTFGLKQAEFVGTLYNDKEFAKLFRYMLSSMLLFQYIGQMFGMKWDDSFKTLRWGMPPAFQFALDLYRSGILGEDKYGNKLDAEKRTKLLGKSLFTNMFPAGAQIARGVEGIGAVNEGASRKDSGELEYRIDQTPMNYLRAGLWGKRNLSESKEYYDKLDKKKKEKSNSSGSRAGRY